MLKYVGQQMNNSSMVSLTDLVSLVVSDDHVTVGDENALSV